MAQGVVRGAVRCGRLSYRHIGPMAWSDTEAACMFEHTFRIVLDRDDSCFLFSHLRERVLASAARSKEMPCSRKCTAARTHPFHLEDSLSSSREEQR